MKIVQNLMSIFQISNIFSEKFCGGNTLYLRGPPSPGVPLAPMSAAEGTHIGQQCCPIVLYLSECVTFTYYSICLTI
jgi:hypothetical protein